MYNISDVVSDIYNTSMDIQLVHGTNVLMLARASTVMSDIQEC